jgi:hypothetical protein
MIRALRLAAFVSTLAVAASLSAQAATGVTFESVDGFRVMHSNNEKPFASITVTGLVEGQAAPEARLVAGYYPETCERMLTLSMERPGRYLVTLNKTSFNALDCTITRRK